MGSLYAAAASYLEARSRGGRWLLRMEDLDGPRELPGAADGILRTLEAFGFEWDGPVTRQSQRTLHYAEALAALGRRGATFSCTCSRSQLEREPRYPGTCRTQISVSNLNAATRLRVPDERVTFRDDIQGEFTQHLGEDVGDFILKRRDGIIAYVLAVVVDDAAQGINHVVRGADLLEQTPRQLYLMEQLQLAAPGYAHVPLLLEPEGTKLAKSARSVRISAETPLPQLVSVFALLGMSTSIPLHSVRDAWAWAIQNWNIQNVPKRLNLQLMS